MLDAVPRSSPAPPGGHVIAFGFDVGARRIGIAVGSRDASPRPLAVIQHGQGGQPDWTRLDHLTQQWQPTALIVGDPLTLDGKGQPARVRAHRFAHALQRRYNRTVFCVDERSSSVEAARAFAQARATGLRRRRDGERLDAMAAAIILERWLIDPSQAIALSQMQLGLPLE